MGIGFPIFAAAAPAAAALKQLVENLHRMFIHATPRMDDHSHSGEGYSTFMVVKSPLKFKKSYEVVYLFSTT